MSETVRTENPARLGKRRLALLAAEYPDTGERLPRSRSECRDGERPCPFVSCRYHLAIDVRENGSITWNRPGTEIEEQVETCALDVADRGPMTLEEIASQLEITREAVRQIEAAALRKLRARRDVQSLGEDLAA